MKNLMNFFFIFKGIFFLNKKFRYILNFKSEGRRKKFRVILRKFLLKKKVNLRKYLNKFFYKRKKYKNKLERKKARTSRFKLRSKLTKFSKKRNRLGSKLSFYRNWIINFKRKYNYIYLIKGKRREKKQKRVDKIFIGELDWIDELFLQRIELVQENLVVVLFRLI